MAKITISITGVTDAIDKIEGTEKQARRALIALSERVYDLAVHGAERHSKSTGTGALVRSLGSGPLAIPGGWEIRHSNQIAPHAYFVHWGTRAHDIRPRIKKALRWVEGNEFVFAKRVRHPGYKGDPYLVTAANTAIAEFRNKTLEGY